MPEIILTADELRYITLFQDITSASARDCIIDKENNRLIFITNPGEAGKAIGRRGSNINKLRQLLSMEIEVVEYAEKLEDFVRNIFAPARVKDIRVVNREGRRTLYVLVEPTDKGRAIGRGGRKVHIARLILKRYFDIDDVKIR